MKLCWLKQLVIVLSLIFFVSCNGTMSRTLSNSTQTPPPLTHSTVDMNDEDTQSTQLAFVSDKRQRNNLDIWLFDLTTEQMDPLTSDDWQDVKPAWSPNNGEILAFISFKVGESSSIRMLNLLDHTLHTLVPPEPYISITDFVWSEDGTNVFYTTFNGQKSSNQVWQFNLQTGERHLITNGEFPISVSHDNQYLGFSIRKPEDLNYAVFRVFRLSDKTELQPPEEQFHPLAMAWSPSEAILTVTSGTAPPQLGQVVIYSVSQETISQQAKDSVPVEPRTSLCDVAWSPNAQKILVVRASIEANLCQGELLIYATDLASHQILPLEGLASYPTWSKDGNLIIYDKNDTLNVYQFSTGVLKQVNGEIWATESTGANARPIIANPTYNGQPTLRP